MVLQLPLGTQHRVQIKLVFIRELHQVLPSPTTPPTNFPSRTLPRRRRPLRIRTGRVSISVRRVTYTYAIRVSTLLRRRMQTRSYSRVIPSREHLRGRHIHWKQLRISVLINI